MRFIADFHIHSKYSLATSSLADAPNLDYWAKLKGVDVLATGDCIHPKYLDELKTQLQQQENGLFTLKDEFKLKDVFLPKKLDKPTNFMLTTEISCIYKKNNKTRKIHNICVLSNFESASNFQKKLEKIGNIHSDGRPILGIDAKILLEILLETDEKALFIPAHIWTPWFSVLGSKSGFDSIEECFEDLTPHIFALETGLSSDPPMNWACSFLDNFRLVSNSDAHSPEKIGREANIFDCEKSYTGIYNALKTGEGFTGTIEFFPQEGKYFEDGHRKCNIHFNPLETIKHQGICPVCNTPLTKGVLYRVSELADRDNLNLAKNKRKFYSITSLPDIISEITGKAVKTKTTQEEYFKVLEQIGSDFYTLLFANLSTISQKYSFVLAEAVRRMREGQVHIKSGFDGEFGTIKAFESQEEIKNIQHISLFDENINDNLKPLKSINFDIKTFQKEKANLANTEQVKLDFTKYTDLSDTQKICINHKEGPIMVVAGPGTGKTKVLVERIAMLVRNGIEDFNILAITFTNYAVNEIKNRLSEKILNFNTNVLTFHKLALEIIKENNNELYQQKLLEFNDADFDFDTLILEANKILENPEIREKYKKRFKYVLVDEFQDINLEQYKLLTAILPKNNPNLFVIGDPNQAIYGFRGADVKLLNQLKIDYPKIKEIKLQKSYRCPSNILKLATQALKQTEFLEGTNFDIKAEITEFPDSASEAEFIAKKIEEMIGGLKSLTTTHQSQNIKSLTDFAILCRTSYLFEDIANALKKHSIPFKIVSEKPFYKNSPFQEMIKDLQDSKIEFDELKKIKEFNELTQKYNDKKSFLEYIMLATSIDELNIKEEAVNLMTMHGAKGLEFECVFIPAAEEGILPFEFFKKKTKEEIDEEERLFYVATTRTKKYLFITYSKKRMFSHRLVSLNKSEILDRFEKNLIKLSAVKQKEQKKQIEFMF